MRKVRIGLLGLGTVGGGVYKLLVQNRRLIERRTGLSIVVGRIAVKNLRKKRDVKVPRRLLTSRPVDLIRDPQVDIVVELIGGTGPAGRSIKEAIRLGKPVVTANKALLAQRGGEIFRAASRAGLPIGFEASVAGGIPIIQAIREGFVGNRIQEIYGIINGTSNYILTEMASREASFSDVLREAQRAGFAERNSRFDVGGIDAAQKLAILISLAYGVEPSVRGILTEGIDQIRMADIKFAREFGYLIKPLAIAKEKNGKIEARVHPTLIPASHPLADVGGVFNAVFLKGDAVGETMFLGRGAGRSPTASAVVADIARIALADRSKKVAPLNLQKVKYLPIEELVSEYYLRFSVVDRPGILAQISKHLGDNGVSIASVEQPGLNTGSQASVVVMTHQAKERDLRKAVTAINRLSGLWNRTAVLRVQRF